MEVQYDVKMHGLCWLITVYERPSNLTCKMTFYVNYRLSLALSRDRNFFWAIICTIQFILKKSCSYTRIKNIPLYCSVVVFHHAVRRCDVIILYCGRLTDTLCLLTCCWNNQTVDYRNNQKPAEAISMMLTILQFDFRHIFHRWETTGETGDISQWLGCFLPFSFGNEKEEYLRT